MKKQANIVARRSYYFGHNKKWFHILNIKYRRNYEHFFSEALATLRKKANDPQVENYWVKAWSGGENDTKIMSCFIFSHCANICNVP